VTSLGEEADGAGTESLLEEEKVSEGADKEELGVSVLSISNKEDEDSSVEEEDEEAAARGSRGEEDESRGDEETEDATVS
jgi:hypothetical protein